MDAKPVARITVTAPLLPPPANTPPVAVDDLFATGADMTVTGNVLDDNMLGADSDADGDAISVTAIQGGTVGEAFQITTAQGHTGMVTVQADGTFTFDPDDSFKALAQDEQDSFNLTYTIIDSADKIPEIKRIYDHSRTVSRPAVAIMTRDVLRGEA